MTSYVISQCHMCMGHMTCWYKRSDIISFWALLLCWLLLLRLVLGSPLAPPYGWCPMRVGCDASSVSPGWSLLPSSVFIVLALVNSNVPHRGDLSISTRPGSAASLPDSTASTGLLCLLVGAHVHCGRSNTEVGRVATTVHISHLVCDIYI